MEPIVYDIIIIGGGHAGIAMSYYLKKLQVSHLVLEKGRIGDTWRNQRWDSFRLNTPVKFSILPGHENTPADSEGFWTAGEFVAHLEDHVRTYQLPVCELCEVMSVEKMPDSTLFDINATSAGSLLKYRSKKVVVASGSQNEKWIPGFSRNISNRIYQIHAGEYRNPSLLPEGAVLVVGGAQSGVQIAEDLAESGRQVYFSTSQVARVPRRYRGRDIVEWLVLAGFYDTLRSEVADPAVLRARTPQVSGVGQYGHTVSLQALAGMGVKILGKAINAESSTIMVQPDAVSNVKFADDFSAKIKTLIDNYILRTGSDAGSTVEDIADVADEAGACASQETILDLNERGICSVIWTSGFRGNFNYLKLPVFDDIGNLIHNEGSSEIEGLYFLGLPWMRKRKSGIILGIAEDAEFIANKIIIK